MDFITDDITPTGHHHHQKTSITTKQACREGGAWGRKGGTCGGFDKRDVKVKKLKSDAPMITRPTIFGGAVMFKKKKEKRGGRNI